MKTRWSEVAAWRDRLAQADLSGVATGLSPQGLQEAVNVAVHALNDRALEAVAAQPGTPYGRAAVVTAGTTPTAALEWLALLLGRGSEVVWKHPEAQPGLAPLVRALAGGLPLNTTDDRDVVAEANVVIAMGSDAAVADIRRGAAPNAVVHAHGHAWSCAWITGAALGADEAVPADFRDPWGRLAADAALHDTRGCLSPAVVFTPLPLEQAVDALAEAMERAQARWPIGEVHPGEAAMIRARRAMARVVGAKRSGEGWSVHGLTLDHVTAHGLPRSLAVVHAPDAETAARTASQWGAALSTVGTDDPDSAPIWHRAGATRICSTGRMQRPPLDRIHDGVRWVTQTYRAISIEGFTVVAEA